MNLIDRFLVLWLPPEIVETCLGLLDPHPEGVATSWTVAAQVVGESGPGLWLRVLRILQPNGEEIPLAEPPIHFLRWEMLGTTRLYETLPSDLRRIG